MALRRPTHVYQEAPPPMSAIGNLWSLSVVGPFIAGSAQMTKLTCSQCLQEILTTLWA
jgi:hypothetical protein